VQRRTVRHCAAAEPALTSKTILAQEKCGAGGTTGRTRWKRENEGFNKQKKLSDAAPTGLFDEPYIPASRKQAEDGGRQGLYSSTKVFCQHRPAHKLYTPLTIID